MITLLVWFIISLALVWLLSMYTLWQKTKEKKPEGVVSEILPLYNKSSRVARKVWFKVLRLTSAISDTITRIATKVFFALFPKARKAFEKKDELTGLHHGPSSYFLKSISSDESDMQETTKKIRRKRKNV